MENVCVFLLLVAFMGSTAVYQDLKPISMQLEYKNISKELHLDNKFVVKKRSTKNKENPTNTFTEAVKYEIETIKVNKNCDTQRSKRSASYDNCMYLNYINKATEISKLEEVIKQLGNSSPFSLENVHQKQNSEELLLLNCIEDIQKHNFEDAEEKLELIDENKINFIVKKLYNNQTTNFNLLLAFGNYTNDINRKNLIYKALSDEIDINDFSKRIELIESLKVFNQSNLSAKFLNNKLKEAIKIAAIKMLKKDMLRGYYDSNTSIELANINKVDDKLFCNIIQDVVDDVYKQISVEKVLTFINSIDFIDERSQGFAAMFNTMQKNNNLNDAAIFKLANYIKKSMNNSKLKELKNKLPESVKNVVFSSTVCIKNVLLNEYLYAPNNNYLFDYVFRRYIFTWISQERVSGDQWKFEPDGDNYYIKNVMTNDYLYAAHLWEVLLASTYNRESRYVFNWTPGMTLEQSIWKIEPDGDDCYIKNTMRNEYLYAGSNRYDYDRRYAFTWIPGNRKPVAKWKIENC